MKRKSKLLSVAFLGAALLLLLARTAAAGYFWDGAVQNSDTGNWNAPNDMICVVGIRADGTLDVADGITNSRECIYLTRGTMNGGTPFDLTTMTTSDQCTKTGFAGNDGAKHSFATSICVDANGNGIALTDLDRTMSMCVAKGGIWKQTSATPPYPGAPGTYPTPGFAGACVATTRQFKGQDASGTPLAFGTKGTSAADAGFCYASMNITSAFTTPATQCPAIDNNSHPNSGFDSTSAYDWAFASNKCTYAKGIAGYPSAALTKTNGSTISTSTWVDLSLFTTMGECLANGGTWNNWVGQPASTTSVATTPKASKIPVWDYTRQSPDADNGCLHCHSTTTQYNGPAERQKSSYLLTGHKNMLRKVTPGKSWAGPNNEGDLEHYTSASTGPLDFTNGKAWINGVWQDLLYIFGDWMSPTLNVIVNSGGFGKYNGTGNYSCAGCHTTGWSNPSAGVCSLSSKTTSSDCTNAGGTWYPSIGVQGIGTAGYTPAEPGDSFPGIIFTSAGKWNRDGIQCSRCHNAAVGKVTDTQIAASAFPSTHVTNGGMGALAAGVGRTNLCFGCHGQSLAKTNNGLGADNDLDHPENLTVRNMATAPNYVPDFGIHPIGNMFLNSPHARYTGKAVPNALGKYDLEDPTRNDNGNAAKYSSLFQGYTCWQSSTSTSPAKTMIVDGVIKEIKTKSDCETLYGAGAWRSDLQGTCVTCHDVHNSLFIAEQRESALRKVCTDCHTNKPLAKVWHPTGLGTPLDVSEPFEACITCHMPRATDTGLRMHLWRVNTDANYRTFPTAEEFGIGAPATNKNANASPDGAYTNAVWVDVDYTCGQCHGGSRGPDATRNGAPYIGKDSLAERAAQIHINSGPTISVTADVNGYTVTLTDSSTDDKALPANAVNVQWGDKKSDNGNAGGTLAHIYSKPKKFVIVYTVTDKDGAKSVKKINIVLHKDSTQAKK